MKISTTIFFFVFISSGTFAQNFWQKVNSFSQNNVISLATGKNSQLFAGVKSGGVYRSVNNGQTWTSTTGLGSRSPAEFDFSGGSKVFAMPSFADSVYFSNDTGKTWSIKKTTGVQFDNFWAIAVNANGKIFGITENTGVYLSTNDAGSWTQLTGSHYGYTISISPTTGKIFTANGKIYSSSNDGSTWIEADSGISGSSTYVVSVNAQGEVYAFSSTSVYRSANDGISWTLVGTMPAAIKASYPAYIPPAFNALGHIFVSTTGGVCRSADKGVTWTQINTGLTTTAVASFTLDKNGMIYAATPDGLFQSITSTTNTTPSVTVTSPKGGERWRAGSTQMVSWSSSFVNGVNIQLSTNSGSTFPTSIVTKVSASSGAYTWTVPVIESSTSRIRVGDTAATSSVKDSSHANFTIYIAAPAFTSTPQTTGKTGQQYSYSVTTYDSAALAVTDSALKLPTWATFNTSTKTLSGTPTTAGTDSVVLQAKNSSNKTSVQRYAITVTQSVDVKEEERTIHTVVLGQNYPNPFSQQTTILLQGSGTFAVRDMLGRVVYQTTVDDGGTNLTFDGSNVPHGLYEYSLSNGVHVQSRIMMIVR